MRSFAFFFVSFAVNGFGFRLARYDKICATNRRLSHKERSSHDISSYRTYSCTQTRLQMVRNVDLPEALVFYGLESIFEPPSEKTDGDGAKSLKLQHGILRILQECEEVGTAALVLSEFNDLNESELKQYFANAWDNSYPDSTEAKLKQLTEGSDPVLSFRCINTAFTAPSFDYNDDESECIEYLFYNLKSIGRSPSPAFLLDSLQSIHIEPRGFGGSSGFARGQWVEPRRCPISTRTVVFIAGDWKADEQDRMSKIPWISNERTENSFSTVKDRCAAVRAAGCRLIYLENPNEYISIQDNEDAISRCDAVIHTYGNDNPRDLQPISLDAISTPGDYWLNPPCPRDDSGNAVVADDVVNWFRAERELKDSADDAVCTVDEDNVNNQMSEDEMERILADMDKI